jgi:hypothetical protein
MIHALSGDSLFIARIEEAAFHGTVHSRFDRTLNIRCADSGDLYTVACRDLDNGPNTLIMDCFNLRPFDIKPGEGVSCSANRLYIGNRMALMTENADYWQCILPEYPARSNALRLNLLIMKQYIDEFGKCGGMKTTSQPHNRFEKEVSRMLQDRSVVFLNELCAGRKESAIQAGRSLLGLGPGLTPSGDDFLMGIFAVINLHGGPLHAYTSLCQGILWQASQRTNDISLAALKQAASGLVRDSIVKLIDTLAYGTQDLLLPRIAEVLRIGSSSGTDIAMGIYAGLRFSCQYECRRAIDSCQSK